MGLRCGVFNVAFAHMLIPPSGSLDDGFNHPAGNSEALADIKKPHYQDLRKEMQVCVGDSVGGWIILWDERAADIVQRAMGG